MWQLQIAEDVADTQREPSFDGIDDAINSILGSLDRTLHLLPDALEGFLYLALDVIDLLFNLALQI